jgi:hypothetical protein
MTCNKLRQMRGLALLVVSGLVSLSGVGQTAPATPDAAAQTQAPAAAPATQDSRDLKPVQSKQNTAVTIPRSYALVVGISAYKNLPKRRSLSFPIAMRRTFMPR